METPSKIKVTVAGHSFEAEGPDEAIAERFALWMALVEKAIGPQPTAPPATSAERKSEADPVVENSRMPASSNGLPEAPAVAELGRIFNSDNPAFVALTVPVQDTADAVLVTLYGFKAL